MVYQNFSFSLFKIFVEVLLCFNILPQIVVTGYLIFFVFVQNSKSNIMDKQNFIMTEKFVKLSRISTTNTRKFWYGRLQLWYIEKSLSLDGRIILE